MLNTGISTLAPVDPPWRSRASASSICGSTKVRYPRGQAIGRAEPWQPCRRDGNVADAGAGAASGRHDARRSQPRTEAGDAGRIDAVGPEFAELQPLRQLWRSDTGDIGQGEALLAAMLDDLHEQAAAFIAQGRSTAGRGPKRAAMKAAGAFRWTVAVAVLAAMLASAVSFRADAIGICAASSSTRCVRPAAQDRSWSPSGTIHVAFAPGDITLPKKAARLDQDISTRAVDLYGRFPVASLRRCWCPSMAGASAAARRGAIAAPPSDSARPRRSTEDVAQRDWVMVHEMVHTALPDMPIATPGCRRDWPSMSSRSRGCRPRPQRAGNLAGDDARHAEEFCRRPAIRASTTRPTWGQYWGGAIFCLLADIEIPSGWCRLGLQDAMRGVLAAGGNHEQDWPIAHSRNCGQSRRRRRADLSTTRWGRSR